MKVLLGCLFMMMLAFGGDKGNGGGYVRCDDGTVMMADRMEGIHAYEQNYDHLKGMDYEELKRYALSRIFRNDIDFGFTVGEMLLSYEKNKHVEPMEEPVTGDHNIITLPRGCFYYGLANWHELSGKIFVNSSVYESDFDEIDKAFLAMHEAIYAANRKDRNHTNSDLSRRINAFAFGVDRIPNNVLTRRLKPIQETGVTGPRNSHLNRWVLPSFDLNKLFNGEYLSREQFLADHSSSRIRIEGSLQLKPRSWKYYQNDSISRRRMLKNLKRYGMRCKLDGEYLPLKTSIGGKAESDPLRKSFSTDVSVHEYSSRDYVTSRTPFKIRCFTNIKSSPWGRNGKESTMTTYEIPVSVKGEVSFEEHFKQPLENFEFILAPQL